MIEDKVARFDDLVAGEARLLHRFAGGVTVVELRKAPAIGRGVFARILDHKLNPIFG